MVARGMHPALTVLSLGMADGAKVLRRGVSRFDLVEGDTLEEVEGIFNSCTRCRTKMAEEWWGTILGQRVGLLNEGWPLLTHKDRGP